MYEPRAPDLGVVGHDREPPAVLVHLLVGLEIRQVAQRHTPVAGNTVGTHERLVEEEVAHVVPRQGAMSSHPVAAVDATEIDQLNARMVGYGINR